MFLCFGLKNQKLLEFLKITCLANHIRDGFRKQQMTLVTLPVIQLTTAMMESIFITSSLLLFTKSMWIITRKQNNVSCLLSWDLVTGCTRITLEWPPISWRRCSSPCTIQYVDSVTCSDSCAWRPSRTQWRRGRTHSARDKSADRACKKYILPRQYLQRFQIYFGVHTLPPPREIPSCCEYCSEHSVSIKFREFIDWHQAEAFFLSWFVQY